MFRHTHRQSVDAVIRRTRELARPVTRPAEGELRATAQSLDARRRSGEDSGELLSEILVTCARAVHLATGQIPAEDVIAAAAHSAVGVVPFVPDDNGRRAALAMTAYWHATAGEGVHVMVGTEQEAGPVKEFLAKVLGYLGSSVGLVSSASAAADRRSAYSADATVGPSAELSADFLRDNLQDTVSDTVQRRLSRLSVADVDEMLLSRAREQTLITAPASRKAVPAAVELAAHLRNGIDYRPDPRQRAVHIATPAMGQVKAGAGWKGLPTPEAVSAAMAVEQELLRREGLAEPEERRVLADISLRGHVREYPIVTSFAGKPNTEAARLVRLYGLDAVSNGSPLIQRLRATRSYPVTDEEEIVFEDLFDAQRRAIYDLRRQVRDPRDLEEIARVFLLDAARHWSTQGMAAVQGGFAYVLRRNALAHLEDEPEQLRAAAIGALAAALDEVHRTTPPFEISQLIRSTMLTIIDTTWWAHIARVRFLQRQAAALYARPRRLMQRQRDLDYLFAGCLRAIKQDSLMYSNVES